MNARYFLKCAGAGLVIGLALVLALMLANTAAGTEANEPVTPPPGIVLLLVDSGPSTLSIRWADASDYWGEYKLISDVTGAPVATFPSGQYTATVDGLTCGVVYRFWLVGGNRASNSIVGQTGPCKESTQ